MNKTILNHNNVTHKILMYENEGSCNYNLGIHAVTLICV